MILNLNNLPVIGMFRMINELCVFLSLSLSFIYIETCIIVLLSNAVDRVYKF